MSLFRHVLVCFCDRISMRSITNAMCDNSQGVLNTRMLQSAFIGAKRETNTRRISIMTFNVLAPCYFRHGGHYESEYESSYAGRAQEIIYTIQREDCDIICLQEFWFRKTFCDAFEYAFKDSHVLHSIKRPGEKEDGLAILINKSKFKINSVHRIQFDCMGDRVAMLMHISP